MMILFIALFYLFMAGYVTGFLHGKKCSVEESLLTGIIWLPLFIYGLVKFR